MRKAIIVLSLFFSFLTVSFVEARSYQTKSTDVWVNGYTKKNGTYVPGYWRSAPDNSILNNYGCADDGICGGSSSSSSSSTYTPSSSSTSNSDLETAKINYSAGVKALQSNDYTEALEKLRASYRWNANDTTVKTDLMKTYMVVIKKALAEKKLGTLLNYVNEADKVQPSSDIAAYRALYHLANSNCTTFDIYVQLIKGTLSSELQTLIDAAKQKCSSTTATTGDTTIIVNPQNSKVLRKLKAAKERVDNRFKGLYSK